MDQQYHSGESGNAGYRSERLSQALAPLQHGSKRKDPEASSHCGSAPLRAWQKACDLWGTNSADPDFPDNEIDGSKVLEYLNSWCYCLWDINTLEKLNFWTQTNSMPSRADKYIESRQKQRELAGERASATQKAREQIYLQEGTGWFVEGNPEASYIKWSDQHPGERHCSICTPKAT